MEDKIIKFTPRLSDLVKDGTKFTTFRLFDDKNLSVGDHIRLATRDGDKITIFGTAYITNVNVRTIATLKSEDFEGHEPVQDPLLEYRGYYGNDVQLDTEVKVIRFKVIELYS